MASEVGAAFTALILVGADLFTSHVGRRKLVQKTEADTIETLERSGR